MLTFCCNKNVNYYKLWAFGSLEISLNCTHAKFLNVKDTLDFPVPVPQTKCSLLSCLMFHTWTQGTCAYTHAHMCICICSCTHSTHMHTGSHACLHTQLYSHEHILIWHRGTHTSTTTYAHTDIPCLHAQAHTMYMHGYAFIHTYAHTCMHAGHIHAHEHTQHTHIQAHLHT